MIRHPKVAPPKWLVSNHASTNIEFIHALRGLAVLIVVFVHLGIWWTGTHHLEWSLVQLYRKMWVRPLNLYQDGGHLGVVLFFLISGYIITHVSLGETRSQFIIKRLFRLFPMLFLACLAMLGAVLVSRTLGHPAPLGFQGDFTMRNFLESLLLLNFPRGTPYITSVAWTLFIEAVFYLQIAIIITKQHQRPLASTYLILAPIWVVSLLHLYTPVLSALHLKELASLTPFVAILALGRSFYLLHQTSLPRHRVLTASAACFLTFALTYNFQRRGQLTSETLSTYYVGILIFLALMNFPNFRTPRPLNHTATISYSLYLLHIPAGCLVLELMSPYAPFSVSFPIALATLFILCGATYRWIEAPFQTLGRRLLRNIPT